MQKQKIGIILQARMGSSRLPGKVLKKLLDKPMIQWIVERLQCCQKVDRLILATSISQKEQPLVNLIEKLDINIFRGSEADVLDRYYQCAMKHNLDYIIRATGDNPFVDPEECDRLIDFFFSQMLDYSTISTDSKNGYPLGVGVEIFNFAALKKSWLEGKEQHHREHVNEYILENPQLFKQAKMNPPIPKSASDISLTVDTHEQFTFAHSLYMEYRKKHTNQFVPVDWIIQKLKEQ